MPFMISQSDLPDTIPVFPLPGALLLPRARLPLHIFEPRYLALDDVEQAEAILNGAPAEIADSPEVEAARAQLALAKQAADAGPVAELRAAVEADPQDRQARFDLAQALHASGDVAGAVDTLLDLFRLDAEWNDGAAKAQLFTIFEALKPNDPIALHGRRKLSSMIFA